jgi:protein phosphatase
LPIVRGDRYVLCSDGLVDEVVDDDIATVLLETEDPQLAADELVRIANDRGGHDNITVVVVDVIEGFDPPDPTDELDIIPAWAPPQPTSADVDVDTGEYEPVMIPPSLPAPADDDAPVLVPRKRNRLLRFLAVVGIAAVLITGFTILAAWARDGYFVAFDDDDRVVIYKGRPDGVLWFDPTLEALTEFSRDELDDDSIDLVEERQRFESQRNAANFVQDRLESTTTTTTTTTTATTTTTTTTTTVASTTSSGP